MSTSLQSVFHQARRVVLAWAGLMLFVTVVAGGVVEFMGHCRRQQRQWKWRIRLDRQTLRGNLPLTKYSAGLGSPAVLISPE